MATFDPATWTWCGVKPKEWQPQVTEDGDKITVTFFTYSGLERETISRRRDTFRKGSYSFKSSRKDIATGPAGYIP